MKTRFPVRSSVRPDLSFVTETAQIKTTGPTSRHGGRRGHHLLTNKPCSARLPRQTSQLNLKPSQRSDKTSVIRTAGPAPTQIRRGVTTDPTQHLRNDAITAKRSKFRKQLTFSPSSAWNPLHDAK